MKNEKVPCSLSDSLCEENKKDVTEEERGGPPLWDQGEDVYSTEVISTVKTICGTAGKGEPEKAKWGRLWVEQETQEAMFSGFNPIGLGRAKEPHKTKC